MNYQNLSVKHVRRHCLECCGGSARAVMWCNCDGKHSPNCELWPFRHGLQPATFRRKYGDRLVNPDKMPPADIEIEKLPHILQEAATGAIDIEGYSQPAVHIEPPKSKYTEEERRAIGERFRRARECAV